MAVATERNKAAKREPAREPSADREEQRRAAILEASRKLFQRYGYKKTTMDEIAKAAGITKPTVYTYFKGKKEILVSLVEWEASRVLATGLASSHEEAGVIGQLAGMFQAVDDFLREDSFLQGIVGRDPDVLTPEVIKVAFDFERQIMQAVEEILAKGMDEGVFRKTDARLMAYAIVRLHEAFTFSTFFDLEGYGHDDINAFFIETLVNTLQPRT